MSLIDQQKDLESFSDQSLLQEAQQPMRGYPPYLVMAEIQRRQQDRQRVERQMAAQQEVAPPVAQQQAAAFAGQIMQDQAMAAPQGITAAMPAQAGMGMGQPMEAPMAPPEAAGIMGGMPVQGMAGGGEVKRMQEGRNVPGQPLSNLIRGIPSALRGMRSPAGLMREIAAAEAAGRDTSALRAELAALQGQAAPAIGEAPVATPSSAPAITSVAAAPRIPGIANIVSGQVDMIRGVPVAGDTMATPTATPVAPQAGVRPTVASRPGIEALQEVAVTGKRADEFTPEMLERYYRYQPNKEEFEKMRQAELLAGLGEVIGTATQRGDIARGLSALTRQQQAANREFRREQRDFEMGLMGIKERQRAEQRADVREQAAIARDQARFDTEIRLKLTEIDMRRQALREEAAARVAAAKNDAERLAIARQAQENDDSLLAAREDLLKAQSEYYRGKGTSTLPLMGQNFASASDLNSAL